MNSMIPVTKPYIPSVDKYQQYVKDIFERNWLTNNGPLVRDFESRLKDHLGINGLLFVSNGTIALQIAIKALKLKGEIITTPFSYIATTSSIVWEDCKPIFVDINSSTLNIDPQKIESAITSKTSAILATHCFGNACEIDIIQSIADKYKLKIIYDAAHCFGTKYKGKSIFEFGDISTTSLHATKLMHSVEGGLVATKDLNLLDTMTSMRNFGHDGPEKFNGLGINGKNSEFHAAMGICVLDDIDRILEKRKQQSLYYDALINDLEFGRQMIQDHCQFNYAYYPLIFKDEKTALGIKTKLEQNNIFPRRYFYPSLSSLSYVEGLKTPVSDRISSSILCLPLFHDLKNHEQDLIIKIIRDFAKND